MKEIPLGNGQNAKVDDEDYEWLNRYSWYAYYDPERKMTYAAHDTPSPRYAERKTGLYARCHYGPRFAGRRADELRINYKFHIFYIFQCKARSPFD